jgi:hypothetical protein
VAIAGAIVILIGVGMVVVSVIFALFSIGDLRAVRVLRRSTPTPIGSWRTGRVSAEGVTEFGPAGRQTAPLSGAECTWFHVLATCSPSGDDGDLTWHAEGGRTPDRPALADATGRVPVDPRVLAGDGAEARSDRGPTATESTTREYVHRRDAVPPSWIPPAMAGKLRKGDRVTVREIRLPRGRAVYALGRFENGVLIRRGRTIFTPGGHAELINAVESDLRLMRVTIPVMFAGGLVVAGATLALMAAVTG